MARFTCLVAVFLILVDDDKLLFIRRKNTGWSDGNYDLVAGHVDGGEPLTEALARETREEVGISIEPSDARLVHLMHFIGDKEYLYTAFEVRRWSGEPTLCEEDKHDAVQWFPLSALPENITPSTRAMIDSYRHGDLYSEFIVS